MMSLDTEKILLRTAVREDSWKFGYIPETKARLSLLHGKGFAVYMRCYEKAPRAVHREPDSPVYEDSCMECFLNFYPEEGNKYLNFEVNSMGTLLCQEGNEKAGRIFLRDKKIELPVVIHGKTEEYWEISYVIRFSLIQQAYQRLGKADRDFTAGKKIKGNFYKCGDKTEHPHFGSWKKIDTAAPDFHQPDFFGEIEIL